MSIYRDFEGAWVDRVLHGSIETASRLANARHRMQSDPEYSSVQHREALDNAQRTVTAIQLSSAVSDQARSCYVDIIDRCGKSAKWWYSFPDVASACSFARDARRPDEFIRIIPPIDLVPDERKQLDELGVVPTERFIPPTR